jgi:glutathione S-transferase
MEEEQKVKLYGMWASTYVKRVEVALRAKGIACEYIEEDLSNKSQALLQYDPVHNEVPVLVHNGKPITESSIILEYIDETWKQAPRLLPDDPYQRAKVRFWASFIQQQVKDHNNIVACLYFLPVFWSM